MSDNLAAAAANSLLNSWAGSAGFIQLHTADPGTAGTTAVSSVTTRMSVTWGSASAGVLTASSTPQWTAWAGTNGEVVTDISFWSASTAGTFQGSMPLASAVTMNTSDSLSLTPLSVTLPTAS